MRNVQNEVSFIGLGMMGSTLAQLALRHGYSVTVWNRTSAKVFGGNVKYLGEQIGAASAMDLATLSYVYGAMLGFFHGARIAESEGFRVDHYGSLVAEISPTFGEFFRHEGAVIQSGNYEISESPLKISVEATERLAQAAREGGINAQIPTFAAGFFKEAVAAGYENEEVAALIKVFRSASGQSGTLSRGPCDGDPSRYNSKVKELVK